MNNPTTARQQPATFSPPRTEGRVGRVWTWIRRCRHCRGFGVQSPSAYHFIRYVVNEHYPYYAYTPLRRQFAAVRGSDLRLMKLYLRLANHLQAPVAIDLSPLHPAAFRAYVQAGCRRTQVVNSPDSAAPIRLLRLGQPVDEARLQSLLAQTDSHSVVVVEHIGRHPAMRQLWQRLVGDPRVSVSYDLHYCGIAFFDSQRYKQNYIVSF